jgi:hypothetical protein
VQLSDDQQFLHLLFDSDDGATTLVALAPDRLGGLIATLVKVNAAFMEGLRLQDQGPEGPGE